MRIQLTDDIILTSDRHNFILNIETVHKTGKKKGQKYLYAFAFYPTLTQAISGALNAKLKQSTAKDLKGLRRELHELTAYFRKKLDANLKEK